MDLIVKGRFLIRRHIWFENIEKLESLQKIEEGYDEIVIHGNHNPIHGKNIRCEKQESLITDLTEEKDNLWSKMSSTIRNEINRSNKEGIIARIYDFEQLNNNSGIIDSFVDMVENMYAEKGLQGRHISKNELYGYISNKALIISEVLYADRSLVYHSYVVDGRNCRLLHSCSEFRNTDSELKKTIGRANKFLHWEDINYFKEHNYLSYDWGGIQSYDKPNGIDTFKMAFGGKHIQYYNIYRFRSLASKLHNIICK